TVQFKKPSLVFIRQAYDSGEGRSWLVVSDGRRFSYPVPPNLPLTAEERLVEAVTQNGVVNTCQDIYAASSASLKDRSAPLDIAFGRLTDLRFLRNQWVTLRWLGQQSYRDRTVDAIGGDWREYGRAPASGTYRMLISKDSDLVLYELAGREAVGDPARGILVPLLVTSTWEVDLHPNAETDDSLFKL
ncbi:MAG: hypothetical protein HY248_05430, partial [Fimbriimonas ginsengisoli]|nr:hypothetical protein [Fimbriimonas ginsengisoli]